MSLTLSIAIFLMFRCNWYILFLGIWKIIYLHLDIFRETLLNFNHSFIHAISELILNSTLSMFMLFRMTSIIVKRVLSSAYIIKLNKLLLAFAISLTYMIKNEVEIKDSETGTIYHCGEQWLHNGKATLFKDISTSSEIMSADIGLECKNLGRNVHNYNDDLLYKSGKAQLWKRLTWPTTPRTTSFSKGYCTHHCWS